MHINNIGHGYAHDRDFRIDRPYGSGDNLLLLLLTPAVFTFDGTDIHTEADSFILFKENEPQFYRASGDKFANDFCHFFTSSDDLNYLNRLGIPFGRPVKLDSIEELSEIIRLMVREHYSDNPLKHTSLELYMKLFFTKLSEKLAPAGQAADVPYFSRLSELRADIYNTPYRDWDISELAARLSLSLSYFQHIYTRAFGISVANDIIRSRIEYSKYLLSTTDMPVSRIAEMCGYRCEPHFMRQFRSRTGITPSQYRKGG
ncbi:MAG: helix-turn-helix transcriptional regulator [Huintestinicola sp.]